MTANPEYLARLRSGVGKAPFPQLLGLELAEIDFDSCRIDLVLAERHLQPFGIVHGGVLASLIDTATFWAVFLRLPEDDGLVAHGTSTLMALPGKGLRIGVPKFLDD